MTDINKTTHTGTAITNPAFSILNNGTPLSFFTFKCRETWEDKNGMKCHRDNLFKLEGLKRNAHWIRENVKAGRRYIVDGTLRSEIVNGVEEVKVRVLRIVEENNDDYLQGKREGLREGLTRAFALVENSINSEATKAKLEILLRECQEIHYGRFNK